MRPRSFTFRCLMLAFFSLLLAVIAGGQSPSSIQIFMPNGGMPPAPVRITITRDDGYSDIVFTDSKGRYQLGTPRNETVTYRLVIDGDKLTYDTTTANITLDRNSPNQHNVFLRPLAIVKLPADSVLDVSDYEKNVPAKARAAYKRGMEAVSQDQAETAITNLQEAIALYPQYVRALNDLGVVYLKLERLKEAEATFRQASEINKRYFHPRLNLGLVLEKEGKHSEALEVLEPLYNENRSMHQVRMAYAAALERTGRMEDAQKLYYSITETANLPGAVKADAYFGLGLILNRQGKYLDAITQFQKSIQLAPNVTNSHLQLGAAYLQVKNLWDAESELLKAYALGGSAAGAAQLMLGEVYYTQKRFDEAERAFAQYLKDVPAAPNAAQITQLIADIRFSRKSNQ
jgi:tetratricopeptide (TPR) repeat protein